MKTTPVLFLILALSAAANAAPYGAGFYDTSEYMMGKVAVSIIFPESTSGSETWSEPRKTLVVNKITAGMNWWAARNSAAHLSFVYVPRTVATSYEPIECNADAGSLPATPACPNGEEDWIKQIMGTLGYSESDYFDRVFHYNNDTRDANSADWAFTFFVADSNNDADGMFADGYFGYAYVGGPFSVMTYDNDGYGIADMDAVAAHETGHIFYALDEYYSSGGNSTEHSGYLNGYNTNFENSSNNAPEECIMRGGTDPFTNQKVCSATYKMLGWSDVNSNGKLDILDLPPTTALTAYTPDPTSNTSPVYAGAAHSTATYANINTYDYWGTPRTPNNISIDRVASVEYKVDAGSWLAATASDGFFDESAENFTFTASGLGSSAHTIQARAKDTFDAYDATPASDSLTVDSGQAQDIPYVYDGTGVDADYTRTRSSVSANWGTSYHSSGINHYEYAIGTAPGGNQVIGWLNIGTVLSYTKTGLSLSEGTSYYFSVRAYPNAGTPSGSTSSDGFVVDNTSPTARVLVTSALPAATGAFSAKLIVSEASALSGTPQLSFRTSTGLNVPLTLSFLVASTWTASGYTESYYSTGTATFQFSASDVAGNSGAAVTSGGTFSINSAMTSASGGSVVNSDGMAVSVPAGAFAGTIFVSVSTVAASAVSGANSASPDSTKVYSADLAREFTARDLSGNLVTSFSSPVTITMTYPDADNDGRIDVDLLKESTAWIYYLDTSAGKWTPIPNVTRNPSANTLTAQVSHFSVYSVRTAGGTYADMSDLKAYPNPCNFRASPYSLTIEGIPADAASVRVFIYNEAGELVRSLARDDGINGLNIVTWDGKDSLGAKAASGLYIYLIKTSNYGKGSGKFFSVW